MATNATSWPWLFKLRPTHSEALKEEHKSLVESEEDLTELDFTEDEVQYKISGCVAYIDKNVKTESPQDSEDFVQVNFTDQAVNLPAFVGTLHSIDPSVRANDIRYVGIIGGTQEGVGSDDRVVLLSIWISKQRGIVNVYLQMPSIKDSLMLANSVSKMLFEACGKKAERLGKFFLLQTGAVSVSSCTTDERDEREKQESEKAKKKENEGTNGTSKTEGTNGTLEADIVPTEKDEDKSEGPKPLEEKKMFFVLDEESLCLYDHPLSPKPTWDFRFYKESQENAIDVIYVCNTTGELEIEQQERVFYIKAAKKEDNSEDEHFGDLSKVLREGVLKPKPQEIFTDLKKFVEYFGDSPPTKRSAPVKKPAGAENPRPFPAPADQAYPARSAPRQGGGDSQTWLTNLKTGSHLQNVDEELQIRWFMIEPELTECLKANLVPDSDIESAGLNAENAQQLLRVIEDIRDKLLNTDCLKAMSILRAVMSIYKGTLLQVVAELDEVEFLKRIFFLTE